MISIHSWAFLNKTKNSFAPLNSLYTVFDFSQMTFGVNTNTTYTPVVVVAEPNLYQIIKCCTKLCQISSNDCEGFVILWSCAVWQVIHMAVCVCCGCFIAELKVFSSMVALMKSVHKPLFHVLKFSFSCCTFFACILGHISLLLYCFSMCFSNYTFSSQGMMSLVFPEVSPSYCECLPKGNC